MNRFLKYTLILFGILLAIIILLFVAWNISSYYKRKQAENDFIKYSKECDSTNIITEQPEIIFSKFKPEEINVLKFQILRKDRLINDTLIKNNFKHSYFISIKIPYKEFYKTDTILVTTKNNLKFYISGYHHVPYLHYGMFGYVGSHDCRISEICNINGNKTDGIIVEK